MPMTLFHSNSSPNSRRVRIFIAEKGLNIATHIVNLGEREQFSDWYKAINPRMQVPTLQLEDGSSVAEVLAIWRYLEEAYPQPVLLGASPKEKALVTMWERRAELDGFAPTMEGVRNAAAGLKGRALSGPHDYEQIPALVERNRQRIADFYADFNIHLGEVPFVAGERFSAADITTLVTVDFATAALKLPIPETATAMKIWYETVAARPSAKA
jgi:glutathione S-transferase